MGMRWWVFAELWTADFVFVAVEAKLWRQAELAFDTEDYFIGCSSSSVNETCIVSKSEFQCQRRAVVSSVEQKVALIAVGILILCFGFTISPRWVIFLVSWGYSQFLSPIDEIGINEGSSSVVYNKLWNSQKIYLFLDTRDSGSGSSVKKCVYHQEAKKNMINQKKRKILSTGGMKVSFVIDMGCANGNNFNLPFFQWNFICVLNLRFVVLAQNAVNSQCTNPVKHSRPVVELFCIAVHLEAPMCQPIPLQCPKLEKATKHDNGRQIRRFSSSSLSEGSL